MKTLKDFQFKNKKVLLRVDFNLPLDEEGEILDDFRIEKTLPTIKHLIKEKAKVIIISHLGRPAGKREQKYSLKPVTLRLEKLLSQKIKFLPDCLGKKVEEEIDKMKEGEVICLENLRFYPGEEKNDPDFAQKLGEIADIFINDAFGTSHREHASISGIPKYLPSGAGSLLEKEIKVLSKVLEDSWRPLVVIIGGVKIETKFGVIKTFLAKADDLLLGGEIANVILRAKGICVTKPLPDHQIIDGSKDLELTSPKLHLPVDVIVSPDSTGKIYVRQSGPGAIRADEGIFDIGPETVNMFSDIIAKARMLVWSGPLGLFENPMFERGTREIGDKISRNHKAFKIAGGGATLLALKKFNIRERFDFVSTSGGAMLKFLAGESLPGIEALK